MDIWQSSERAGPPVDRLINVILYIYYTKNMIVCFMLTVELLQIEPNAPWHDLILLLGCPSRPLNSGGAIISSCFFVILYAIAYLSGLYYKQQTEHSKYSGLSQFICNRKAEDERIGRQIDKYIDKIKASNSMYELVQLEASQNQPLERVVSFTFDSKTQDVKINFAIIEDVEETIDNCYTNLMDHLDHLTLFKKSVWPANRKYAWQQQILSRSFLITVGLLTNLWFGFTLTFLGGHILCYLLLVNDTQLPAHERGFSTIERLDVCIGMVGVWHVLDHHFRPVVNPMMALADQRVGLHQICDKLDRLNAQIQEFLSSAHENFGKEVQQKLEHFDRKSTELYIMFRVFADEAHTMHLNIEYHVVFFFMLQLFQTIAMILFGKTLQYNAIYVVSLFGLFSLNLSIYPCAAFNKRCHELTKAIQTLIAQSETTSGHQLISNHGKFLWNRVLQNREWISSMFGCKLAGSIKLDFKMVLQLNFWIISTALFLFSNINHRI